MAMESMKLAKAYCIHDLCFLTVQELCYELTTYDYGKELRGCGNGALDALVTGSKALVSSNRTEAHFC